MNKKIFTKLLLLVLGSIVIITLIFNISFANWQWQNPLPQGNILSAIWLADQNHIYAVGYGSTIIQSNDGGTNWEIIDRVTPYNLRGIWGTGNNNIYAVGEKGTILYFDGTSWEELQQITQKNLNAIWGTGENNIFMVGDEGIILHYNGFSTEELQSPVTENLHAIWGRGDTDIYAVGGNRKVVGEDMEGTGGIVIHFDGNEWSKVNHGLSNVPNLNGIWGKDNGHLYLVGGDRRNNAMTRLWHGTGGIVLHFDGNTWDLWTTNSDWNFYSIWGDESNLYTVGAYIEAFQNDAPITYGKLFRLNGNMWEEAFVEGGNINGLLSISGYNNTVFSVGLYGTILRKNSSGWQEISYGTRWSRFFMLGGVYPDQLFAVGGTWDEREGVIVHYNTSLGRWEEVFRGDEYSTFLGVWGAEPDDIYVVGSSSLHYNGYEWKEFTTCKESTHFWIWGSTPNDIYTWGSPCRFNGITWEPFCPGLTRGQFHGEVWGTNTNDIYAAGDKGLILQYDGGNCQDMNSGLDEILRGIWGSSSQNIYAVGGDGLTEFSGILHYDGQTWEELTIPHIMQHLYSLAIYFGVWGTGADNVFITGYNGIDFDKASRPSKFRGTILHYNGNRWEDMSGGMGSFNNFVWGLDDGSHVYTGGMAGAILSYNSSIRGSIGCCVEDTTGNQISEVTVSVFAMGNAYWYNIDSQLTGNDGCVQINELEPGRYYLMVEKNGFLPTRYPVYGSFVLQENEDLNVGSLQMIEGTSTSISSTTTTTICTCPLLCLYDGHSKEISFLRNFRDNVLSKTPEGQELMRLYYQWSPVVVREMGVDEDFKKNIKEIVNGIIPMIGGKVE